jgi:predicted transcriptional regulator
MTYKTGSLRDFADWTKRVVRDPAAARDVPKTWIEAEVPAANQVSAEAIVKLLSDGNLAVLAAIRLHSPPSVRALAALTGRKEASLSRTLKRFAELGIVSLTAGPHRTRVPALIAERVHLDIDLTGNRSIVAVDGLAS